MVDNVNHIIELNDESEDILNTSNTSNTYNLLYFTAKWCGPCQQIFPLITELAERLLAKNVLIRFYKIDIDENEEFCEKCDIRSVPTFYIMKGKTLLSSTTGASIQKIGEMLISTYNNYIGKLKK